MQGQKFKGCYSLSCFILGQKVSKLIQELFQSIASSCHSDTGHTREYRDKQRRKTLLSRMLLLRPGTVREKSDWPSRVSSPETAHIWWWQTCDQKKRKTKQCDQNILILYVESR